MSLSGYVDSLGYQQITVNTVQRLTLPINKTPYFAVITVQGQSVRYRDDGTDPTADTGMPLGVGSTLTYDSNSIDALRFIEQVAGGIINVTYYGKNP